MGTRMDVTTQKLLLQFEISMKLYLSARRSSPLNVTSASSRVPLNGAQTIIIIIIIIIITAWNTINSCANIE